MLATDTQIVVDEQVARDLQQVQEFPYTAWTSKSGAYRMVITHSGPTANLISMRGSGSRFWALECWDGHDLMGNRRWKALDRNGDQSHWREAFAELAQEHGLFS